MNFLSGLDCLHHITSDHVWWVGEVGVRRGTGGGGRWGGLRSAGVILSPLEGASTGTIGSPLPPQPAPPPPPHTQNTKHIRTNIYAYTRTHANKCAFAHMRMLVHTCTRVHMHSCQHAHTRPANVYARVMHTQTHAMEAHAAHACKSP